MGERYNRQGSAGDGTRKPQPSRPARGRRRTRRAGQLDLDLKDPPRHGGRRRGAGRKPTGRRKEAPHRPRPDLSRHHPVHVTLRAVTGTWNLRARRCYAPIHGAIAAANAARPDCRVVHFSVQGNHLHLLVEAESARALSSGIKGLAVRIARRLNRVMGRRGRLFGRYHAEILKTPRRVRHALAYVLNNLRRHAAQWGEVPRKGWADPFSSARWFDGWKEDRRSVIASATGPPWMGPLQRPVPDPRTWLLKTGWRRHGLVSTAEVPGGSRRRTSS